MKIEVEVEPYVYMDGKSLVMEVFFGDCDSPAFVEQLDFKQMLLDDIHSYVIPLQGSSSVTPVIKSEDAKFLRKTIKSLRKQLDEAEAELNAFTTKRKSK